MKRLGFLGCALFLALIIGPNIGHAQKPDILEVIEVHGEIHPGTAVSIADHVEKINDNAKVKAVLLVIDSPGGSVTASSAIYEELSRLKAPVVAWCQSVCASGGVYIMMAPTVKFIGVRNETISGSVGVILHTMRFNRLLEWAKVDPKTYRSGLLKDAANPTRPAEEAEVKYLQGIVDVLAERFYGVVGKSRKITDWEQVKTARIFIGQEAVQIGLADAVVSRKQAETKAKELSGSKTIFTRDELKKMSSAAHGDTMYSAPPERPSMVEKLMEDGHYLASVIREIHSGESVKFSYRMPYSF